jgi:hypothetical protein
MWLMPVPGKLLGIKEQANTSEKNKTRTGFIAYIFNV